MHSVSRKRHDGLVAGFVVTRRNRWVVRKKSVVGGELFVLEARGRLQVARRRVPSVDTGDIRLDGWFGYSTAWA